MTPDRGEDSDHYFKVVDDLSEQSPLRQSLENLSEAERGKLSDALNMEGQGFEVFRAPEEDGEKSAELVEKLKDYKDAFARGDKKKIREIVAEIVAL